MSKQQNPHPHVAWRNGRPRFVPGPSLRKKGYQAHDLKHDDGTWYTKGQAVDWSLSFCKRLAETRTKTNSPVATSAAKKPFRPRPAIYTIEHLFDDWFKSPKFMPGCARPYSENTINNYSKGATVIQKHAPELYASAVEALTKPIVRGLYEELWKSRGLSSAYSTILTLSSAISWAILRGKVQMDNPCFRLRMETPEPRIRFASREEIDILIATADRMGRPEIGDMVMLAVWTGQRQNDRLLLDDHGLLNGRRVFRQNKTKAIVAIRSTPILDKRFEAAATRRRKAGIINPRVILDEKNWKPFLKFHYRHTFADIRNAAIAGDPDNGIAPCDSLQDFKDQDLRDTSVTWQALAGATIPEIIAVTGHTMQSATRILRHYLARHPEMADNAISKMLDWYQAGGKTDIGF